MEAEFIHLGVTQAIDLSCGEHLIMDIGGGSVEFIHVIDGFRSAIKSFPIGIAHVYNSLQKSDPISIEDREKLNTFLDHQLNEFFEGINKDSGAVQLIGCAGTFEIFGTEAEQDDDQLFTFRIDANIFQRQKHRILKMSFEERRMDPFIPESRAKYIQVAMILIDFVVTKLNAPFFIVSKFGLKEGLIWSN